MTTYIDAGKAISSIAEVGFNKDNLTSLTSNELILAATHIMFKGTDVMKILAALIFRLD